MVGWQNKGFGFAYFIDLRDRQGVIQLAFDENVVDKQILKKLFCSQ